MDENGFISRSEFRKIREIIKKFPPNLDYLMDVIDIIHKNKKHPLIFLPELYPDFEGKYFSIKFKEAKFLYENLFELEIEGYEDVIVPVAAPGLLYGFDPSNRELAKLFYLLESVTHTLVFKILRDTELPYGIFIGSDTLAINAYLWESVDPYSEFYFLDKQKVLIIMNGKVLRSSHRKSYPKDNLIIDLIEFATGKKEASQIFECKEMPFWVISSPLAKKISPKKTALPFMLSIRKIGMNELKASFVVKDDLIEGAKITGRRKKRWYGAA